MLFLLTAVTPASAGTTSASTFSKTGTDATTGSTGSSTAVGSTGPGDTINWVLNYGNATGSVANVKITDPISGNQTFVPGSLKTPPSLSPEWSTNGGSSYGTTEPASGVTAIGATGPGGAGASATSVPFTTNTLSFNTPGGDGYTVEGLGNNVYTVFHHDSTATTVFCSTLGNQVCPGWPAFSTYVNPTAGTPIGTGAVGPYTTAGENGSFIANGNLYWSVEDTQLVGGAYPVGFQCLNLTSVQSCGFTQLDTETLAAPGGAAMVSGDGIPAANGNYYFFDWAGNMLCFSPTSGACGVTRIDAGLPHFGSSYTGSILTSGTSVFVTFTTPANELYMSCYDTAAAATCPGFPVDVGVSGNTAFPDFIAPVLSAGGTLLYACAVNKAKCYSPTSAASIASPYVGFHDFGFPGAVTGFGSGAIVGSKFYAGDTGAGEPVDCFDFAAWTGVGAVPRCSGFTGPGDLRNYTVRPLANLPGCLAADGDGAQIVVFNALTGAPCSTGSASVKLTPASYYCDGKTSHTTSWGSVSLGGLTGSEYGGATVTLVGTAGPVPGWTNVTLAPGSTSLDLTSISVSGSTATLTAEVTLSGVTNTAAAGAATVKLSWHGDAVQVCFQTKAGPTNCNVSQAISNSGNAVTSVTGGVSDAPAGNDSGRATLLLPANPMNSACQADLSIAKTSASPAASPGGRVMYTLVVQNHGPDMATAVAVSDAIPAGLTIVSVQPSQGTCTTAGAINCSLGTMVNGGSAQILVTATVAAGAGAGATIDNSATVSGFQADPNPANNASSATITIVPVPPTPPPAVDLQVVKHVSRQVAAVGQPLTYTIDVKNNGPGTVPDAIVTDTSVLPLDATSIKPSQGTCAPGVPFTCHLGTLAAGKTATITVTAHATKTGSETNWVTDSVGCRSAASCPPGGPPRDTNLSNNISHAKTTLKPAARLVLMKTASRRVVAAGQNITFHLRVSDPTSVAIYQVTLCDTLPSRLGYESSNPKAHRHRGARCWTIGKLGAHRSKRFTVVANASPGRARKLVNHATASAPGVTTAHASAPVRVSGSSVVPCVLASQARVHTRRHRHGPKARIAC